jgi:phage head maturation protease
MQDGHNSTPIGRVVVVAARDRWWMADCVVESDDPKLLERIKVGAPISVGFDPISSDDDSDLRLRRHGLARLRHIAVLRRGEIPAYADAKITGVVEAKAKPETISAEPETLIHRRGQLLRRNCGTILGLR